MVEITLYSMRSYSLTQYRDLRIWSGLEDHSSTSKSILGALRAISLRFRKPVVRGMAVVKSGVNKRCSSGASCELYQSQEHG